MGGGNHGIEEAERDLTGMDQEALMYDVCKFILLLKLDKHVFFVLSLSSEQ